MDINKILTADVLDIIFEGRNKEYGAYDMRKTYHKRIKIALLGMFGALVLVMGGSILANKGGKTKNDVLVQDLSLENVKQQEEKKPEPPPPPPPPKQEPPKVEITKFTPPKIVKDEEVKEDEKPPEVDKLEDTKIGTFNQEGTKDEGIVAPVVESKGTGVVEAPAPAEDYDKLFTSVQIESEFPGGQAAWIRYLERNLNANAPQDNGAPIGRYQIAVSFTVDKEGNISDVSADKVGGGEDYGTIAEAIKVIKKGPKWKPGVQNGVQVKSRKKQLVTFQVTEE